MRQFSIFVLVGGISAFLDLGMVATLLYFSISGLLAVTIGFVTGVVANFWLHSKITFQVSFSGFCHVWRFAVVLCLNYLLTVGIITLLQRVFGLPTLGGKLASLPIVAIVGYFLSRTWVFR